MLHCTYCNSMAVASKSRLCLSCGTINDKPLEIKDNTIKENGFTDQTDSNNEQVKHHKETFTTYFGKEQPNANLRSVDRHSVNGITASLTIPSMLGYSKNVSVELINISNQGVAIECKKKIESKKVVLNLLFQDQHYFTITTKVIRQANSKNQYGLKFDCIDDELGAVLSEAKTGKSEIKKEPDHTVKILNPAIKSQPFNESERADDQKIFDMLFAKEAANSNLRTSIRYIRNDIDVSITLSNLLSFSKIIPVTLLDIGSKGVGIECKQKISVRKKVMLNLLFDDGKKFTIAAKIIHQMQHIGDKYQYGIKFNHMDNTLGDYLISTQTDLIFK